MEDNKQRENITRFYQPIQLPGGYSWSHTETLRMIDLYWSSKFKSGQYDSLGFRKFFYNVVKPACEVATKFVDLHTKDLTLVPAAPGQEFKVWMMSRKLKEWLKDTQFGDLMNRMSVAFPKYGSVVVKVGSDDDCVDFVNIQNLRMNTTVECLCDSDFVYEISTMSRQDIEAMSNWDQKGKDELFNRGDDQNFDIYDCYDKSTSGWKHTVKADLYATRTKSGISRSVETELSNQNGSWAGGVVLFTEDLTDLPYREFHWEQIPGRWLGVGFVEYLEENQIAENETENLERKGLIYTSLKLFQTRDENVGGSNILSAAQNGDILTVSSDITPIAMEERNLAAYTHTRGNWQSSTQHKTFTFDVMSGQNLPSRTTLGVAKLQVQLAASFFDFKRTIYGLFLRSLILDDVIPNFKNQTVKEHLLTFASGDEELDKLDQAVVDIHLDHASVDYALKTGFFPSQLEREALRAQMLNHMKKGKHRFVTIPASYYAEAKYSLDVNVTNEAIDNGAKSQVLQLALQTIATNPGVLQDEVSKAIFFQILAMGGLSPVEIGLLQSQTRAGGAQALAQGQPGQPGQPQPQVAGSLARPQGQAGMMPETTQV